MSIKRPRAHTPGYLVNTYLKEITQNENKQTYMQTFTEALFGRAKRGKHPALCYIPAMD